MQRYSFRAGRSRRRLLSAVRRLLAGAAAAASMATLAVAAPVERVQPSAPAVSREWRELPAPVAGPSFRAVVPSTPVSLASADFDDDGMPDLAVGFADGDASAIAIYRGNVDAVYPNEPEAQERLAAGRPIYDPFLPEPLLFEVAVAPDALATGDFDDDGHLDLAVAANGGMRVLLAGDGRGGFGAPEPIDASGIEGAEVTRTTIPMRLNEDGVDDFVVLRPGHATPSVSLSLGVGIYFVVTESDSGAGSLRQAIVNANAKPGLDKIDFSIATSFAPFTIRPLTPLPFITDALLVDGTTQTGYAGVPIIEIDGSLCSTGNGLVVSGSATGTLIRALVINNFDLTGVYLAQNADDTVIDGSYIGTDRSGLAAAPNDTGVFGAATGDVLIGGTTTAARNVIAGNTFQVAGNNWTSARVVGNYIGVRATGAAAMSAPGTTSLAFRDVSHRPGVTQLGEPSTGGRNVISGTIHVDAVGRDIVIQNNYIGTDAAGAVSLDRPGAILLGVSKYTIGGTAPNSGNVISGLAAPPGITAAISVVGPASGLIRGNRIGTDSTGTQPLGNEGAGISVFQTGPNPENVLVMKNVIAFNGGSGVDVQGDEARVSVHENSIHSNGRLGIDLDGFGVTPNDPGDVDGGPNGYQNAPVITSAQATGSRTVVTGTLSSLPDNDFVVEFFANTACDPSGRGEGQTFIGSIAVRTNANGTATFVAMLPPASHRSLITSTATRVALGTSEFSPCVGVTGTSGVN